MGVCPAGICPASGSQWPPHAGHRVFIAYRLPVAIKTVHMFTTRLLLSVVSVLLLPIDSVLPIFKPTSSICVSSPWCYSSQVIK